MDSRYKFVNLGGLSTVEPGRNVGRVWEKQNDPLPLSSENGTTLKVSIIFT